MSKLKVETYDLKTSDGKHIRKATKVVFPSGLECRFLDKISKREAIAAALTEYLRNGAINEQCERITEND